LTHLLTDFLLFLTEELAEGLTPARSRRFADGSRHSLSNQQSDIRHGFKIKRFVPPAYLSHRVRDLCGHRHRLLIVIVDELEEISLELALPLGGCQLGMSTADNASLLVSNVNNKFFLVVADVPFIRE
jgi:hypothetical protein